MSGRVDPHELLGYARELLARPDATTAGLWPRAAALLTRQALEVALGDLWMSKALPLDQCSWRTQLACLPDYLEDEEAARRITHAWSVLSEACHYRAYDLPPTADELAGWIDQLERSLPQR